MKGQNNYLSCKTIVHLQKAFHITDAIAAKLRRCTGWFHRQNGRGFAQGGRWVSSLRAGMRTLASIGQYALVERARYYSVLAATP